MARFLHAADIHLDSPLRGLEHYETAPVDRIRSATRRAFEALVRLAIAERVDLVLLAGDLYDGDWRDYNTGLFLNAQLARLGEEKIPVCLIRGNHDAANRMSRELRLPDNVRLLPVDRPDTVVFDDVGLAIHGQSFPTAAIRDDLSRAYPAPVAGCLNIGLLHSSLSGFEGHEPYAPCSIEALRSKGYDYWALGHVHRRQDVCLDPLVVFPGNLQGRHIREGGAKGAVLVQVDRGQVVDHTFHRLDVVRWEPWLCDGRAMACEDDLYEEAARTLDMLLASESRDRLLALRLVVRGPSPMHDRFLARPEHYTSGLRSLACERGGDAVWVERVQFATEPTRTSTLPDGPLQQLLEVIDEYEGDAEALASLGRELSDVWLKVRKELADDPEAPRLDDPRWLAQALVGVRPLLLDLLSGPAREGALS